MMKSDAECRAFVKGLLKAEMKRRAISYQELAHRLEKMGIEETPENLANKVSRGKFSAVFFVQCLAAVECNVIRLMDE